MKRIFLLLAVSGLCTTAALGSRRISEIPGDGVITCGPDTSFIPLCPDGVGTVSLLSGQQLTGTLTQSASTLGFTLNQSSGVLEFTVHPPGAHNPPNYNPLWMGPLGLDPDFHPNAAHVGTVGLPTPLPPSLADLDATVPISGQDLTLQIRNGGAETLSTISFFLGRDVNSLSTVSDPQDDGLTFGLFCSGKTHAEGTADDCSLPSNWKLLLTPSGPGTLNPADTDSSTTAFGDVLRFEDVNLAPGDIGQFKFFVTDNSSTRTPPGSTFTPANQSFVLDVQGGVQPVPEPGSLPLLIAGAAVLLGVKKARTIARGRLFARYAAIGRRVRESHTLD